MLIARSWLQDYIDISDLSDKTLAETLVDLGIEVETISSAAGLDHQIVVGQIVDLAPHPNADTLTLCTVRINEDAASVPLSIVCGANNLSKNLKVAVAAIGSVLPGDFAIKAAKIRGIASQGMICSVRELGLGDDHDGIWQVDPQWAIGAKISTLLGYDDAIFTVSLTPNRGDCLSYLGIARDLAARLARECSFPEIAELPPSGLKTSKKIGLEVSSEAGCARMVLLYARGLQALPSPLWLQKRLLASGLRPLNLIVDVTNYCMLELGQPMHAYDYALLQGEVLRVHNLNKHQKITLFTGKDVDAISTDLVISTESQLLGLAGVMGGKAAEVNAETREIILEVAHFSPAVIRATAKRLGLTSDAAMRFERGIDQSAIPLAAKRAAQLLARCAEELGLSDFSCSEDLLEYHPKPQEARKIALRLPRIRRLLGLYELSLERCTSALESLGFILLDTTDERLLFAVPHFRNDVHREIDLIEEIARMIGYAAIPTQLPFMEMQPNRQAPLIAFSEKLRLTAASLGLVEAISFPFVSYADLDKLRLGEQHPQRQGIALGNALSDELSLMQSSTVVGLLKAVARNRRYGQKGSRLFTSGRSYLRGSGEQAIVERALLGAILDFPLLAKSWCDEEQAPGFYHAKALVEALAAGFGCRPSALNWEAIDAEVYPWLHPAAAAEIKIAGQVVGWLGELHPLVGIAYELPNELPVLLELDCQALFAGVETSQKLLTFSLARKFPLVARDFAFVADAALTYQQLAAVIQQYPERRILQGVELFDLYRGEELGAGKKSLALSLSFAAVDKTLTDQEVDREASGIVSWVEKRLGVALRA